MKFALCVTARVTIQTGAVANVVPMRNQLLVPGTVVVVTASAMAAAARVAIAAVRARKKTCNQAVRILRIMNKMKKRARNHLISSPFDN